MVLPPVNLKLYNVTDSDLLIYGPPASALIEDILH